METDRTRLVVGCMTGTSLDGLDVALVKIVGTGLDMRAELLGHHALPMPDALRPTLMSLASGEASEPIVYMRAARALGELHADGVEQLLAGGPVPPIAPEQIDFITAHGQTIWHAPGSSAQERDNGKAGMSWQLFDPWPIVRRLKRPVCYDLRQADLIAGGEGAPLTPIADWVMYRGRATAVYNLGGIANCTWMPYQDQLDDLFAEDLHPCNILLDGLMQRLFGRPYDKDGGNARRGKLNQDVLKIIQSAINHQIENLGSLGRELFRPDWFSDLVSKVKPLADAPDIMRSATILVALELCRPLETYEMSALWELGYCHTIVLAGGGAKNQMLRDLMQSRMTSGKRPEPLRYTYKMTLSDDLGIPCEAREAMGFAVLGALSQDGVPISLPQVTGATDPGVAGVWANP
jgi:1,6-anhydro-N-acetylmuramate kinase